MGLCAAQKVDLDSTDLLAPHYTMIADCSEYLLHLVIEMLPLQMWDYVLLEGPEPQSSSISKQVLQTMRREFNFWYPFDLRVCLAMLCTDVVALPQDTRAAATVKPPWHVCLCCCVHTDQARRLPTCLELCSLTPCCTATGGHT